MLAPSDTAMQPFLTRVSASAPFSSFWVAQGSATSHLTPQGRAPPPVKVAPLNSFTYSDMRPRRLVLSTFTQLIFSWVMPSGSWMKPSESDKRQHLAAQLHDLFGGMGGDIARAGDHRRLARRRCSCLALQHVLQEIDRAIAGGLGADQAAAIFQALAGQHAGELVGDALVLAEHIADLAPADADVAGRHVDVGADMAIQFGHEGLAEAHHFVIGLALGIEVGAALAAAHRQPGQAVLEGLLEGQELQHAFGDATDGSGCRPCTGRWSCCSAPASRAARGYCPCRLPSRRGS